MTDKDPSNTDPDELAEDLNPEEEAELIALASAERALEESDGD